MKRDQVILLCAAAALTLVITNCGDDAMDMMADASDAAGEMMMDAGRMLIEDAGTVAMDSGRDLRDAATAMDAAADAMGSGDAAAQDGGACGCTISGPIDTFSGDSDPMRMRTGAKNGDGIVLDGPFVVTELSTVGNTARPARAHVWMAASTDTCTRPPLWSVPVYQLILWPSSNNTNVHGARLFVPSRQRLCVDVEDNSTLGWSGFVP